jgi:uncharacterized protein (TIGR02145 family)
MQLLWLYINTLAMDCGFKMKTTDGWLPGGEGSDVHGFSGKPGGYLAPEGFYFEKFYGYWWSSNQYDDQMSINRSLNKNHNDIGRLIHDKESSESVRCIKN